jgi:hypothetical protein
MLTVETSTDGRILATYSKLHANPYGGPTLSCMGMPNSQELVKETAGKNNRSSTANLSIGPKLDDELKINFCLGSAKQI